MLPAPDHLPLSVRILLVEDDVLVRAVVADELRAAGYCVIEAVNADEAWSLLAVDADIDLVFSDIQMPGSIDGIELATRIGLRFPGLPVILTSGGLSGAGGVARFLRKPFTSFEALSLISAALNPGQRSDP